MNVEVLLGELGRTITDKSKAAAAKARDLTEIMQLKAQIGAEKNKVQETYAALGKRYYERHRAEIGHPEAEIFAAVTESLERIAQLEEKIRGLDDTTVCPNCGARAAKKAAFCSSCGARLREEEPEAKAAESAPAAIPMLEETGGETASPVPAADGDLFEE